MNNYMKVALLIFAILYFVSPVDVCPGPIDDLIVIVMSLVAATSKKPIEN